MDMPCFICCSKTKRFIKCQSCQNENQCTQCILSQGAQLNDLDCLENEENLFQCPYCRNAASFDDIMKSVIPRECVCCPFDLVEYDYTIVGKRKVLNRKRKLDERNGDIHEKLSCGWRGSPEEVEEHVQKCKLVPFLTAIERKDENELYFILDLYVKLGRQDLFEGLLYLKTKVVLSQADSFSVFREAMQKWPTVQDIVWKTFPLVNRGTLLFFVESGLLEELNETFLEPTFSTLEACSITLDFLFHHHDSLFKGNDMFLSWLKSVTDLIQQVEEEAEEIDEEKFFCKVKAVQIGLLIGNFVSLSNEDLKNFLLILMNFLKDFQISVANFDVYNILHPLGKILEKLDFSSGIFDEVLISMVNTLFTRTTTLPVKLNLFDALTLSIQNKSCKDSVQMLGIYFLEKIASCYDDEPLLRATCIDPRDMFNVDDTTSTKSVFETFPIYKAAKNFDRYLASISQGGSRTDADDYVSYLVNKFTMQFLVSSLLSPTSTVTQKESIESLLNMKILDLCITFRKVCTEHTNFALDADFLQQLHDFIEEGRRVSWNEVTLLQLLITFSAPVFQKKEISPHTYEHHVAQRHIKFLRLEHLHSELLVNVMEEVVFVL